MDKVLIWDDDQTQADDFKTRLERLSQFKVESATTSKAVRKIFNQKPISVLTINLDHDPLEKLEMIGYLTRHKWTTPCIVMIECDFQEILEKLGHQILYLIPKPVEFKTLATAIFEALQLKDEGFAHTGMSLINFLLLLNLTGQTCRLEIRAPGSRKGYFYFKDGELLDAQNNDLHGNDAVSKMLGWTKIMVYFRDLPERRTKKRFKQNLRQIIKQQIASYEKSAK